MTTDILLDHDELREKRRFVDEMTDAFASAIEARQAELREQESLGERRRDSAGVLVKRQHRHGQATVFPRLVSEIHRLIRSITPLP